jgi:hypothetical protein
MQNGGAKSWLSGIPEIDEITSTHQNQAFHYDSYSSKCGPWIGGSYQLLLFVII